MSGQPIEAVVPGVKDLGLLTPERCLVFKAAREGESYD